MQFEIQAPNEFSIAKVKVPAGQKVFIEAGAIAALSTNMRVKALFKGGIRRFLSKESLFISQVSAENHEGEVYFAPGPTGQIGHHLLNDGKFYLASSSFVAHSEGVTYTTKLQKLTSGLLSGAGWFLIEMSGKGDVWFNGYGAIQSVEINGDEEFVLDNNHLVGFTEGVSYHLTKVGSYKSLLFSGEGFVLKFKGQGRVYFQTKKPSSLILWADGYRIKAKMANVSLQEAAIKIQLR